MLEDLESWQVYSKCENRESVGKNNVMKEK